MRHQPESDSFHGVRLRYLELAGIAAILLLALFLRTVNLSELPAGFHGDEAVIGLEAQRILDEGYIGPYSPHAAGQPTGPIYLVAISEAIFGGSFVSVRIVPALLGLLTVLALYLVLRRSFGILVAMAGATILAVMSWHLHFSRIGFPLAAWPLLAVLIAGALAEASRSGERRWWAVAGALTGGGIYVYNAHPLLAAVVCLFVAGFLVFNRRTPVVQDVINSAVFALALLVVLIPMALFATQPDSFYWEHFERDRITETEEWRALDGWTGQASFGVSGYRGVWDWLCCSPELDPVDGSGLVITTPPAMLLLAAFGMIVALGFFRKPIVFFGLLVVLIMPLGAVISVGGEIRRTFVMTPFLAMFCAIAAMGSIELARREGRRLVYATGVASLCVLLVVSVQNLNLYFREFADPDVQEDILGKPIADAAKYLDGNMDDNYVLFYSDIWSIDYATMLYLAPDVRGEDRSSEFGEFHFDVNPEHGRPVFVFLGVYLDEIETVRELYPGQEVTPDDFAVRPTFRVYEPILEPDGNFDLP